MTDWPGRFFHKPVISSISLEAAGGIAIANYSPNVPASTVHPATNRAIFVPFSITGRYPVTKVWWTNGATISGNVDVGVYSDDGALILHAGTTAQATANVIQSVTLATAVVLNPASYYMALEASSATATFFAGVTVARALTLVGLAQQAVGSMPLPNSFTLAAPASAYLPIFGIANASVI